MSKKKSDIRKIYRTTDGYFANNSKNKKKRFIAVLEQRDDGALGVAKIFKADGKNIDSDNFIHNVVLLPDDYKILSHDSVVGNQLIIGRKIDDKFIPLYPDDFNYTGIDLSKKDYKKILENIKNENKQHRQTYDKKVNSWKNFFSK